MAVTFPTRLDGGTLITRDPTRTGSPYTEEPFMRLFGAMDLYLSVACMPLFRKASLEILGNPDTAWAEVAVREINGIKYILVVPTDEKNPLKVAVERPEDNSGLIRKADDVFFAAGIAMVPGYSYKLDVALLEDSTYKYAVVADWTGARQEAQAKTSE